MRLFQGAAICLAVLVPVSAAQAAQRYAAPGGAGEACEKTQPCSLEEALEKVKNGDEVIVTGGTYTLTKAVALPFLQNVSIHGESPGHPPRIEASLPGGVRMINDFEGSGVTISDLELVNEVKGGRGLTCGTGVQVDRVTSITTGGGSANALEQDGSCSLRDSLLRADGATSVALYASGRGSAETGLVRNVTAIAGGAESIGISSNWLEVIAAHGIYTLDVKNTIAQGGAADLVANEFAAPIPMGPQGDGDITISRSNFDKSTNVGTAVVSEGAANQKAAPLFVNAAGGNYREAAGSPTIDAGVADQLGPLDLGGDPRVQGAAADIGAFELAPAPAPASGGVRSISIKPKRFRARPSGGPVAAGILKSKPPKGARVTYTMSGPATVDFSVSRRVPGRTIGKVCKPPASARGRRGGCFFYTPVKGAFTQAGASGSNSFVFSGRIGGKALKPGAYKLTAFAGHLVSAAFEIGGARHHRHRA